MRSYLANFKIILHQITGYFESTAASEKVNNWKIIKFNCLMTLSLLVFVATVLCLTMLINTECSELYTGCLTVKVLEQIYKLSFTTICPQVILIILLSFAGKKIQGDFPLKNIVPNALILACLNIYPISSIVYLANFTEQSYYKVIVITVLICPIISYIIAGIAIRKIVNKPNDIK